MIPILFENEHLLILNKPSGMPSAPLSDDEIGTAVHEALSHFPELASRFPDSREPGLLHRLDTGTSGVLAFAKTLEAFEEIRAIWKTENVRKFYRAVVEVEFESEEHLAAPFAALKLPHVIAWPVARLKKSSRRMMVLKNPKPEFLRQIKGDPLDAMTIIHEIKLVDPVLSEKTVGERFWLYEVSVEIETGVMHQIRAHLSALGAPVLGDPIYGNSDSPYIKTPTARLCLHAERLILNLSFGSFEVEAPIKFID